MTDSEKSAHLDSEAIFNLAMVASGGRKLQNGEWEDGDIEWASKLSSDRGMARMRNNLKA